MSRLSRAITRILTCVGGPCAGQLVPVDTEGPAPLKLAGHVYHIDRIPARVGEHEYFLRWEGLGRGGVGAELLRNYRN
jgi:hypothetical protein